VHSLGVDLEFLAHGKRDALLADQGLDVEGIATSLRALL
jgi:1-deoxy-D-xylulose-5-phosphate synthase